MLRARCIAEGVRAVYPAALGGMMVSEEAQDAGPMDRQDVIDGEATVVAQPAARPELPAYPADEFARNLPKWWDLIASGKKSADELIAMLQSKATFTAEQLDEIRNPPRDEAGEAGDAGQEAQP